MFKPSGLKALKENVPPSTGKSKIPRKIVTKSKDNKSSMPPSASETKKKYAGIVPSDSPKRILGELPREQEMIVKVRKLQQEMTDSMKGEIKKEKQDKTSGTDSDFVKDESALQSILDETGIVGIPQHNAALQRHTLGPSRTPRQSLFGGVRRETGNRNFQGLGGDFIRRTSMMPLPPKRQCVEKTETVRTPKMPVPSPFHSSARSPFHSSAYSPRMSMGPSRILKEKPGLETEVKASPAACHTPVRTPVNKEILSFTAQRVPRTESKETPKPIRLAVTSVKKKKQLTWAESLVEFRSPKTQKITAGCHVDPVKGKKSLLFHGQGNVSPDSNISRNPCDAITSSCISVTSKDIGNESSVDLKNEEPRVKREIDFKQDEMQGDQTKETRTKPFISSHDASQLPVDLRTLVSASEKIVQIQDTALSRPNSGNLGGLSHRVYTASSTNDSQQQQPTQTMTQLSKYPGQGQERLSRFSQQGQSSARTSAASLENVQQIPSHESQMFIKYVEQGTSAQTFSCYSYETSQSQTKSNINVDNSGAMQTLHDNKALLKQSSPTELLKDLRKTTSVQMQMDSNGNIEVGSPEGVIEHVDNNKNNTCPKQSMSGEFSTLDKDSQGKTQAAAYAVDTTNRNESVKDSETKHSATRNININAPKCDTPLKRKMVDPLCYEFSEPQDISENVDVSLLTPKHETVCDQGDHPYLRAENESTGFGNVAFNKESLGFDWMVSSLVKTELRRNEDFENYKVDEIPNRKMSETLIAPVPVHQPIYNFFPQADSSNKLNPPIMTPLAAKDIANKQSTDVSFSTPFRKFEVPFSDEKNIFLKDFIDNTKLNGLDKQGISQNISGCKTPHFHKAEQTESDQLSRLVHNPSPEIDSCGAVDLSKSTRKKKLEKQSGASMNSKFLANTTRSSPYNPRPRIHGSAFYPVRPRLTPDIGSLSLYGNIQGDRSPKHNVNKKNEPFLQLTDNRYKEAMLDEEVARYFRQGLLEVTSLCRRCDNPVAKTLLQGDDMHFIPICEEIEMQEAGGENSHGLSEDSAFTKCNRST